MNTHYKAPLTAAVLTAAALTASSLFTGVVRADDAKPAAPAQKKTMPMMGMGAMAPAVKGGHLGAAVATADLTLDPQALTIKELAKRGLKYIPSGVPLTTEKPAGIVKEPVYGGTPRYGVLHIGNGPNRDTLFVIDDKDGGGGKLYVDSNRNGDLTDDGDGAWASESKEDGIVAYGTTQKIVRASWADPRDPSKETSSGPYSLGIYYREGYKSVYMYRQTARVGLLDFAGQKIPVMLMENNSDGVYDRAAALPAQEGGKTASPMPVWLSMNDSSSLPLAPGVAQQLISIEGPFRLDGKVYEARVTPDGSKLTLYTSDAVIPEPPKLPPAPGLLQVGKKAPDFTVSLPGGGTTTLASLRGKVVVLDFWATWCGPCQRSMPHLEGVYRQLKDRGDATVLAVCVSDERSAFDKWVGANVGKNYTFPVAYDPAGRDPAKELSRNKYGVSGIPTQFVIDKDGKVAAALVGYGGDGDHNLEEALGKLGITVTSHAVAAQSAQAK